MGARLDGPGNIMGIFVRAWSFDSPVGYEGRDAIGAANALVGVNTVSVSSPAPPSGRGGVNCLFLPEGKSNETFIDTDLISVTTATTVNVTTMWVRFSDISTLDAHNTQEIFFLQAWNSALEWMLSVYSTGVGTHGVRLSSGNTPTVVVFTTDSPFSDDTWHKVSFSWRHADGGPVRLWIDGVFQFSHITDMLNVGGDQGTIRYTVEGQVYGSAPSPPGQATQMNAWGLTHWSDNAEAEVTDYGIVVGRPNRKFGDIPECDEAGNVPGDQLFSGDASNIADDTSAVATLRSSGTVKGMAWSTDQVGGLAIPNGYFRDGSVAIACQWMIWYNSPGKGLANEKLIYGRLDGTTYTVATSDILPKGPSLKAVAVQEVGGSQFPDIDTGYGVLGLSTSNIESNRNASIEATWIDYIFEYPVVDTTSLLFRGNLILNGNTSLC